MMQNVLIPTMNYNESSFATRRAEDSAETSHLFRNLGSRLDKLVTFIGSALAIIAETLDPFQFMKK